MGLLDGGIKSSKQIHEALPVTPYQHGHTLVFIDGNRGATDWNTASNSDLTITIYQKPHILHFRLF